jgi:hypothetical protein
MVILPGIKKCRRQISIRIAEHARFSFPLTGVVAISRLRDEDEMR